MAEKPCRDPIRLCPCIRSRYLALFDWARDEGIRVTLLETARTVELQRAYVDRGVSRTMHSKHLPQPPNALALAFDLAPTDYLSSRDWLPDGPLWTALGTHGEALGLEWGGRWGAHNGRPGWDQPHFQIRACACAHGEVI